MTSAMGIYAMAVITRTSAMTAELYDRPLMASSFALSAAADFVRADRALSAALAAPLKAADAASIEALQAAVLDDLAIVEQRFPGARAGAMVGELKRLLADWGRLTGRVL